MRNLIILGVALALVAIALLVRAKPAPSAGQRAPAPARPPAPTPPPPILPESTSCVAPPEVVGKEEVAMRMDEAAVRGLVLDLKIAALRDDRATRRGLMAGLKRRPATARAVIVEERALADDPKVAAALDAALGELP